METGSKRWRLKTQSVALDIFAYLCFIVFVISALILFNEPDYVNFSASNINPGIWKAIAAVDLVFFIVIDPFGLKYIFINRKKSRGKNVEHEAEETIES